MQNSFDVQQQILQRRLLQAQQMRDQEFAPPQEQIVGGRYIKPDFGNALVQSLRAYNGMQESNKTEKDLADLQTKRTEGNNKALAEFLRQSQGTTGDAPLPDGQAGPVRPAQAPDMQGAYAALMQNPDTQQAGMQGAMSMAENQAKQMQAQQAEKRIMAILENTKSPQEAQLAGAPPDRVQKYYESGNWGKEKGVAINGQLVNPLNGEAIGGPIAKQADMSSDLLIPGPDGKLIPNQALIGVKRSLAEAGKSSTNVSVNTGQKGFDNTLKLRGDFRSEPVYKAHQEMQSAHAQIGSAIKQGTPVGDLAAATKIMKLLDPGSVVRESELGMAMAASGLLDRVTNYAQNVVSGNKLTPKQRKDFQALADQLFSESVNQYNSKRTEYGQIAERNALNVEDVVGTESKSPKPLTPKASPIDALLDKYK